MRYFFGRVRYFFGCRLEILIGDLQVELQSDFVAVAKPTKQEKVIRDDTREFAL